ncbi:MAG: IclR family transcriptional regulator C-terminal domain-containing protein [Alphaproteobacteria bacterium]
MARLRAEDAERRKAAGHGPDFLEALARGLRVISAFGRERGQMTLSDVARATDLPKPSVRRALYTLSCLGYVKSDGRVFSLTPQVMTLASAYLGSNFATRIIQPACERVSERTEQSCFAAVLDGQDIVMIAHSMHGNPIALAPTIGLRRPAFCTAAGRIILGGLPDEALDAWLARLEPRNLTDFTVTDKQAIRRAIEEARAQGYCVTEQEIRRGYRAIALPMRRWDGTIIGAICVAAWIEDAAERSLSDQYLAILREETEALQPQLV